MSTRQEFTVEDPDAYEWPCDICKRPFKPRAYRIGNRLKHVPRCKDCCETMLLKMIFGEVTEGDE